MDSNDQHTCGSASERSQKRGLSPVKPENSPSAAHIHLAIPVPLPPAGTVVTLPIMPRKKRNAADRPSHPLPSPDYPPASPIATLCHEKTYDLAACFLIALLTILAFAPAAGHQFVNWDDDHVLVLNDRYRGLAWENLRWMFTTAFAGHYQPLTWLSYALDYRLWGGLDPGGFHMTNIALHVAAAVGFYFVARRLLRAATTSPNPTLLTLSSALAALLFAVHPLRVESIAWVTERRDVLSAALLMPALIFYLRAATTSHPRAYRAHLAAALGFYALSLLSKASAMTLPVVLLLLDVYPLRRIDLLGDRLARSNAASPLPRPRDEASPAMRLHHILAEKCLFLVPAMLSAILALWAQAQSGALRTAQEHSLDVRLAQALYGIGFYLWKSLWPHNLLPLYEQRFDVSPWDFPTILSAVFAIALTATAWRLRRSTPGLLIAWLAYLVFLSPVLGLAQSGPQVVADRYSYFSCLGWAVLAGGALHHLLTRANRSIPNARFAVFAPPAITIALLIFHARQQTLLWSDSLTLWTTVIQRAPRTGTAHANLATELNRRGDYPQAYQSAKRALEILPGNVVAHVAVGRAAGAFGEEAIASNDRAAALARFAEAEFHYTQALSRWPEDRGTLAGMVATKLSLAKFAEAADFAKRLIELDPKNPDWPDLLGRVRASAGDLPGAAAAFNQSLNLNPDRADSRIRLANVHLASGDTAAALAVLDAGIALRPDDPRLCAKLAWLLATTPGRPQGDRLRALEFARRAVRTGGADPAVHEAYAAALAATGEFAQAASWLTQYLGKQKDLLSPAWTSKLERRRAAYEENRMPDD